MAHAEYLRGAWYMLEGWSLALVPITVYIPVLSNTPFGC